MGSTKSKSSQVSGDPQVQILNQLELHAESHTDHDLKTTIILAVVVLQLLLAGIKWYKKHTRTQALKAARSVAAIQQI